MAEASSLTQMLASVDSVRLRVLEELGVAQLWRCRRVSGQWRKWAEKQLESLPPALVLGGETHYCAHASREALASTELLSWESLRWSRRAPLPTARADFGVCVVDAGTQSGLVVAAGTYPGESPEVLHWKKPVMRMCQTHGFSLAEGSEGRCSE